MRPLSALQKTEATRISGILFDLDDTFLDDGVLTEGAYASLHRVARAGLRLLLRMPPSLIVARWGKLMRIAEWSLHFCRLPYSRPVKWFNSIEDGAVLALLRLVGDDGAVGVAEAPLRPTWSVSYTHLTLPTILRV